MANPPLEDDNVANCSNDFPLSQDFFRDISDVEEAFVIVCGVVGVLTLVIFVEKVLFILRHYHTKPSIMTKSMQITGIYPTITLTAMLALCMPRASFVCDLVGSVYISWALFSFTGLLVDYFGGEDSLLAHLEGEKISLQSPPLACCCCCCPKIDLTRRNFRIVRGLVLFYAILQPLVTFLSVVLWLDNKYVKGKIAADNAYPYLAFPNGIATLVAMYGLIMIFRLSKTVLQPLQIRPKLLLLQLVLVFHNLQGFIFDILEKFDIPKCSGILSTKVRGQALLHMMVVFEMFLLAIVARCIYRRPYDNTLPNAEMAVRADSPPSSKMALAIGGRDHDMYGATLSSSLNSSSPSQTNEVSKSVPENKAGYVNHAAESNE